MLKLKECKDAQLADLAAVYVYLWRGVGVDVVDRYLKKKKNNISD